MIDGQEIPVSTAGPNPNGEEFDNLYLDMNGIVHPCSHPEDRPPPTTEEEMMLAIFKYTDRVVNMVRPRKLLMIAVGMCKMQASTSTSACVSLWTAVLSEESLKSSRGYSPAMQNTCFCVFMLTSVCTDGVAPRAKMNQQRSRRFRSAQEAKEKDEDKEEFLKMLKSQNGGVLDEGAESMMKKKTWDSNAITPGTPFMDILAACLRYWCAYKINTDPAWEKVSSGIHEKWVRAKPARSKSSSRTQPCPARENIRLWSLSDRSGHHQNMTQTPVT